MNESHMSDYNVLNGLIPEETAPIVPVTAEVQTTTTAATEEDTRHATPSAEISSSPEKIQAQMAEMFAQMTEMQSQMAEMQAKMTEMQVHMRNSQKQTKLLLTALGQSSQKSLNAARLAANTAYQVRDLLSNLYAADDNTTAVISAVKKVLDTQVTNLSQTYGTDLLSSPETK